MQALMVVSLLLALILIGRWDVKRLDKKEKDFNVVIKGEDTDLSSGNR